MTRAQDAFSVPAAPHFLAALPINETVLIHRIEKRPIGQPDGALVS